MSSHNLESNKIFAAILVAGIVAMLAGFVAETIMEPNELKKDAVTIEGADQGGGDVAAVEMPEPVLALIAAADVTKGQNIAKACAACHSFGKGEGAKVGPNLWGIVNRKRASMAGFSYSDAMTAKGGEWTYEDLNRFLWSPKKFVAGTKMGFIGLKKPDERAAVIAYLKTLADTPAADPTKDQIDQEAKDLAPPAAAKGDKAAADKAQAAKVPAAPSVAPAPAH